MLLTLAEKWANETGRKTERTSRTLPNGTKLPPVLTIIQGDFKIFVTEQGSCVLVFVPIKIADNVRQKLTELTPADRQRVQIAFTGELLSNSRTGYMFVPQKFTSIDQLEGYTVQQVLKIAHNDVGTFNRFCDAIQETVTIAVKAYSVFGVLVSTTSPAATAVKPASDKLYG